MAAKLVGKDAAPKRSSAGKKDKKIDTKNGGGGGGSNGDDAEKPQTGLGRCGTAPPLTTHKGRGGGGQAAGKDGADKGSSEEACTSPASRRKTDAREQQGHG